MNNPLVAVAVMFALSLAGAIVLFKFLRSTAFVQKAGYRAGGAVAGFIIIYLVLFYSLNRLGEAQSGTKVSTWTVVGHVQKEGATNHCGAMVKQVPIAVTATDESGGFRLENVELKEGTLPELQFESKGYYPVSSFKTSEQNATVDPVQRRIELKDTIGLTRMVE